MEEQNVQNVNVSHYNVEMPKKFDFNPGSWKPWIQRFERFRLATELDNKPEENQINMMLYSMGEQSEELVTTLKLTQEDLKSYEAVKKKCGEYFGGKKNIVYERAKFFNRRQKQEESVESFIKDLHTLAESCDFGTLKEELIRDIIVIGVKNARLSEALQLDSELTLQNAIIKARQAEAVKEQQTVVRQSEGNIDVIRGRNKPISASHHKNMKSSEQFSSRKHGQVVRSKKMCQKCGAKPYHAWYDCPANKETCNKCKSLGHFAKVCRNEYVKEVKDAYMGEIIDELESEPWVIKLYINGVSIKAKIDTGADVTIVSKALAEKLKLKVVNTNKKLFGAGHAPIKVLGMASTVVKYKDVSSVQQIFVIDKQINMLVGRPAIENLKILQLDSIREVTQQNILAEFQSVFSGLGKVKDEYNIRLVDNYKPYSVATPRRIAIPLRGELEAELKKMVQDQVITPIEEPTEFCSPIVVVPKSNKGIRVCVDYTELNKYVMRERTQLPSVEESLAQINDAKLFSKLDASNGFWQLPLSKNCAKLTTFITPFGRFYFNRLPFGINSGPEKFQKNMFQILSGLEGIVNQADDILIFGANKKQHDERLKAVLNKLKENGITLNKNKCVFGVTRIKFLGNIIEEGKIRPDPEKIKSIIEMRAPENVNELRMFLGMVNYLMKYVPNLAEKTKVLRALLIKDTDWVWGISQENVFKQLKQELTQDPVLMLYNNSLPIRISADSSSFGLGGVLQQLHNNVWKPVVYISRSLTPTESRYAQIEKEALAVTWACEKLKQFVIGKEFEIFTDHKPLISLLKEKPICDLSARIQRFRMRLVSFNYSITHISGKCFEIPDTLSRMPLKYEGEDVDILEENLFVESIVKQLPFTDVRLNLIKEAQEGDAESKELKCQILDGFRNKQSKFWAYRGTLTVSKGLIMNGCRLFIPTPWRREMLHKIHEGHMGIVKCRRRANESVWWPGLSTDISKLVENCEDCNKHKTNRAEPLLSTELPQRPWARIGMDLMEIKENGEKKMFLVIEDYYSRWIEVILVKRTTSEMLIEILKNVFARFGIPEIIRCDGGTYFTSDYFKQFAEQYGIKIETSSPKFAQSNGMSEKGVSIAKNILLKSKDRNMGLLAYRTTPLENGFSPAELIFGRRIRSNLPQVSSLLQPKSRNMKQFREMDTKLRNRNERNYNDRKGARPLCDLKEKEKVWIPDLNREGVVIGKAEFPRSYIIKTVKGNLRRNRSQLVPLGYQTREDDYVDYNVDDNSIRATRDNENLRDQHEDRFQIEEPVQEQLGNNRSTRSGRIIRAPVRMNL